MNIGIIEDNIHKKTKITSYLDTQFPEYKYKEASSYSSGTTLVEENLFDFLILDMSLPTYDVTKTDGGGRIRTDGGKDILKRLKRKKKMLPFVILTQYSTFSETTGTKTLDELEEIIQEQFPDFYKGLIFYDTSSTSWKEKLTEIIGEISND